MKILSILIPTYHFPEGVRSILEIISSAPPDQVEIIVGDDSVDDNVLHVVREFELNYSGLIKYIRNEPSLGAVKNWNELLGKASGKYALLMHHDEFPISKDWISILLEKLDKQNRPEVILMPCVLFSGFNSRIRIHFPGFLQGLTLKYFPSYLLRRNVIGPISCLIIRRDLYPKFDENLRWLVDVDMYWRLAGTIKDFSIEPELQIASISNRKKSITKSIIEEVEAIQKSELCYLNQKSPKTSVWLLPNTHRALFMGETILWGIFKSLYLLYIFIIRLFKL